MFGFGISRQLSVRSCIRLWEVVARPILEYGAEVWGEGGWEEAEELQRSWTYDTGFAKKNGE